MSRRSSLGEEIAYRRNTRGPLRLWVAQVANGRVGALADDDTRALGA